MRCERCYNNALFEIEGEHLCEAHAKYSIRKKYTLPELKVGDEIQLIETRGKSIGWRSEIKIGISFYVGIVKAVNKETYGLEAKRKKITIRKDNWKPYQKSHNFYGILKQELFIYKKLNEVYTEEYKKYRYNKFKEILDKSIVEVKRLSVRSLDSEFIQEIENFLNNKFKGDDK